jgi:glycosyltransferase involved in cell wall biosynthesis
MKFRKIIKSVTRNYKLKHKLNKAKIYFKPEDLKFKAINVLFIDSIIPEYNKDSGSRRLKSIMTLLLENNVGVFLLADFAQYRYKSDYFQFYKDLGVQLYEPSIYKNKLFTKRKFIKFIAPNLNYVWLHRPNIFEKYSDYIKSKNDNIKLIFDMCDFHYMRLIRQWEQDKLPELKIEAEHYLKMEIDNCKKADTIIAISKTDKNLVAKFFDNDDKFEVLSNLHQYQKKPKNFKTFHERKDLLFIGSFGHTPNLDAVHFLHDQIMPIVWKTYPKIVVNIIGSNPVQSILELDNERFKVLGFIEDIEPYFVNSRLFIAPLRFGAGIKGKIGQSLEYSLPVITTEIGAEGFDFGTFEDEMIANQPKEFAEKIIEMYTNESLWDDVSNFSKEILEPFSIATTMKTLKQIIK